MTSAPFKTELLNSASDDVIDLYFSARPNPASHAPTHDETSLGLLARIRLWLRLLWGRGEVEASYHYTNTQVPNRAQSRIGKRALPKARQGNPLALVMWRAFGRARYLRFIYDDDITGRCRWCFSAWNWKWAKRVFFKEAPLTRRKKRAALAGSLGPLVALFPD